MRSEEQLQGLLPLVDRGPARCGPTLLRAISHTQTHTMWYKHTRCGPPCRYYPCPKASGWRQGNATLTLERNRGGFLDGSALYSFSHRMQLWPESPASTIQPQHPVAGKPANGKQGVHVASRDGWHAGPVLVPWTVAWSLVSTFGRLNRKGTNKSGWNERGWGSIRAVLACATAGSRPAPPRETPQSCRPRKLLRRAPWKVSTTALRGT